MDYILSKEDEIKIVKATIVIAQMIKLKKSKKNIRKCRRFWCRDWLLERNQGKGLTNHVYNELRLEDPEAFKNFCRLSTENFDKLLGLVGPLIARKDTTLRESISSTTRLLITLRYLATGDTFKDLSHGFRVSSTTISKFVPETLKVIYDVLSEQYLKPCQNANEWKAVANRFEILWNFPMCLGAIDGKHVAIKANKEDGQFYKNYKGFNSIILLAVVDADYKFIMVDVGCNGRCNDTAALNASAIGNIIQNNLNFPEDEELPGTDLKVPYVFVSDEAFRLGTRILKPNGQRQLVENREFNYRLSRARDVVEQAFGLLETRFKIFQKKINLSVEKAEKAILACCALHNFLITEGEEICRRDNTQSSTMEKMQRCSGNNYSREADNTRSKFVYYFNNIDVTPSQES